MLGFPLAVVSFCILVTGFSAGLGTLVVVIGVPILATTLLAACFFADVERLRLPAALRRSLIRPAYGAVRPPAGVWRRIVNPLTQTQS